MDKSVERSQQLVARPCGLLPDRSQPSQVTFELGLVRPVPPRPEAMTSIFEGSGRSPFAEELAAAKESIRQARAQEVALTSPGEL